MHFFKNLGRVSAVTFVLTNSTAFADVTSQQVWSQWRDYFVGAGYTINATETAKPDGIDVSGLSLNMDFPDDTGNMSMMIGDLRFEDQSDGTVRVVFPTTMPIKVNADNDKDQAMNVTLLTAFKGMNMIASGTMEKISYNYTASEMSLTLSEILADKKKIEDVSFVLTLADLQGHSDMAQDADGGFKFASKTDTGNIDLAITGVDPETGSTIDVQGTIASTSSDAVGYIPVIDTPEDMVAMMNAGFDIGGSIDLGAANFAFAGKDENGPFNLALGSETSGFDVDLAKGSFDYSTSTKGVTINMIGGGVPLPLSFEIREIGFNILMPLLKGDAPRPFNLGITLADLAVPEMLWGMIDPGGALSHDPATVVVDVSGTATLFDDLVSKDMQNATKAPGEVNTVALDGVEVDIAGARLTGDGSFSLDNTDMATFGGFPRPEGAIKLNLTGGNALLDTLVSMGLVPEDQATGARMMMGLFAVPVGDDALESVISINPEGHVLANGQRIQ